MLYLRKSIYLFIVSFLLGTASLSAQNNFRAVHWALEDGLSQDEVYYMLKDVNNFLWVGTKNGLNRFEGNTFKKYYHNPQKSGTILGAHIYGMVEDSLHNLWIGNDKGIARYDIKADTFSNFLPDANTTFYHSIIPFWATQNEVYCVETSTWVTAYDTRSFEKRVVLKLAPTDSVDMGPSLAYSYIDVKNNAVWILRGAPAMVGGGLIEISLATGKRTEYGWPCFKKITGHNHTSEAMRYDRKRNCLWINSPDGLIKFALDERQFYHINVVDDLASLTNHEKDPDRWVGIDLDINGRVWVATIDKGMVIYDPDKNLASLPFPEDQATQKKVSDFNATVYCDREGITWSGFWLRKGIYQLLPYSGAVKRFSKEINDVPVINFTSGPDGKLWVGAFDGLRIFDPHTGAFQLMQNEQLPGLPGGLTIPILVDTTANKAWIAADVIYEMNLATWQCKKIVFKDQQGNIVSPNTNRPRIFDKGFLTTGVYGDKVGIFKIDGKNEGAQEILSFPNHSINPSFITLVNDRLLFLKRPDAFGNLSYSLINDKWTKISTPLDSIQWTVIEYNQTDDSYWVVAEKQLIHYNKDFKPVNLYTPQEGLPEFDVYNLIFDKKGNIWFNTDRSIHQFHIQTGTFSTLSEKDGFQKQNFIFGPTPFSDGSGTLYFPSGLFGSGFDQVNPNKYTSTPSTVYFQSLFINETPFQFSIGINNLKELSLRYFENSISVGTGVIDYYSKGKNTIRYKLEGLDKTWRYAPNYYTIRYDGLAPNTYTLVIQASNASNEFNGPPKILVIRISPPWWKTLWAYLLYAIAFVSVLWSFIQYRSRNLRMINLKLEENVKERTLDLNQSLNHLKATQAQLIQSEKMASLGELTAGIAHEIQNPLNFVNNFSEVSNELIEEVLGERKKEKGKRDETLEEEILDDIKQNLTKISQHGKRASDIVKSMLEHSRTSSGKKELTNINGLADEYFRLAYHGIRAKDKNFNATLKMEFDESIGKINIIPQDIGRVILNLINNAFYAVSEKLKVESQKLDSDYKPTVSITTKSLGDKIKLSIEDNGNGIPDAIKEKIFQPFFTTKPTGLGTGLGLSLAYDIVTKGHGGTLEMASTEGEGTEFIISLPCNTEHS